MHLVVKIKLLPDAAQAEALLDYMRAFNAATNHASEVGFTHKVFSQPSIHGRCYRELRDTFKISSQTAVRAIGKAVEVFARDKTVQHKFRALGAVVYDLRTFSFKGVDRVSLLTLNGRILVPYVVAEYFTGRLQHLKGQADLVYRDGQFFLHCSADVPEPPIASVSEFLGVDLGIVNLATDSTGAQYSGAEIEKYRKRRSQARASFQRKRTRAAKRRLRKLSGRRTRYQTSVNHLLSKSVVVKASTLGYGIALEDLTGIKARTVTKVRRTQRDRQSNWSFAQLRLFITYKARLRGVRLVVVDPAYTSQTCYACGHCEKANRKTRNQFVCVGCGHAAPADVNAARNISRLGASVNRPHQCPA